MNIDSMAESAMDELNRFKEEWISYHLLSNGIIVPDRMGRFHCSRLAGIVVQEQIKNGWTYLTLMDVAWELASARYRWTDDLRLEWEPLS